MPAFAYWYIGSLTFVSFTIYYRLVRGSLFTINYRLAVVYPGCVCYGTYWWCIRVAHFPQDQNETKLYFLCDAGQVKACVNKVFSMPGLRFVFTTRSKTPAILNEAGQPLYVQIQEWHTLWRSHLSFWCHQISRWARTIFIHLDIVCLVVGCIARATFLHYVQLW